MQAADPRSAVRFGLLFGRLSASFFAAAATVALIAGTPAFAAKAKHRPRAHAPVLKLRHAQATTLAFSDLNGWAKDDQAAAFKSFLKSCDAIRHATPAMRRKRPVYGGLYHVCLHALKAGALDRAAARKFFEDNFTPVRIVPAGATQGFFTGYYESEFAGSRARSKEFNVPLYRVPKKWRGRSTVFGRLSRARIEDGALDGKGLVICWIKDPVDAFFAQIQGSARVRLDTGKVLRLNYIASNGMRYYPVGRDLIDRGIIARQDMSMDSIRQWMEAHPKEGAALRRKNRSYVFFTETGLKSGEEIEGAQGVELTPLRSLAVDKRIHVYGTPIWVEAELPIESDVPETPFDRLMIAQDTGSAIRGPARADIYFGHGAGIEHVAGRIKQHGRFVMLVPRGVGVEGDIHTPLPRPKPPELAPPAVTTARRDQEDGPAAAQQAEGPLEGSGMSVRDRRRVLSREERVLWRTVTQSIAPLRETPDGGFDFEDGVEAATPPVKPRRAAKTVTAAPSPAKAVSAPPAAPALAPLGRRMRQRVARGREAIDARFDLHGLTQSEAHAALRHFLHQATARGHRLVLVITGKGRRNGEGGVLRRQVPQWLALPEFRSFVVGFEDAHVAHGGEGALYVRLRKLQSG